MWFPHPNKHRTTTLRDYTKQLTATAIVDGSTTTYNVTANQYNIASDPLYFVRSGYIIIHTGYLKRAGVFSHYWSSAVSSADMAYNLNITDTAAYPSVGPHIAYYGFSLRCLQE